MENKLRNDLLYICTLLEYIGRDTKNYQKDIVARMGIPMIRHLLQYADVNHCLDMQRVTDDVIEEAGIENGDFDTVIGCKYKVPSVTDIGKVYQRLVADVKRNEDWPETIYSVFSSFISDEISNFNGSVFYRSPEYLKCSYQESDLLE